MTQPSSIPLENVSNLPDVSRLEAQNEPAEMNRAQSTSIDPQHSTQDVPAGYPKLAKFMALVPATAVFRRFGFLNKLNLLYLQADLHNLEAKLLKIQRKDSKTHGDEGLYAKNFFFLNDMAFGDNTQLNLITDIRAKLEKYNTALIQQTQILRLHPPGNYDLDGIQKYIASREMGPFGLTGVDADIWGSVHYPKKYEADIVTLLPRKKADMFTKLIIDKGVDKFFDYGMGRFMKPSPTHGLIGLEDNNLFRLTYLVTTTLASLLPVASIVILYFIHSMKLRLGIIAIFTVLLSFSLAFFTSAKRAEVFALTAAFSAVQVVFVQVGNGTNGT